MSEPFVAVLTSYQCRLVLRWAPYGDLRTAIQRGARSDGTKLVCTRERLWEARSLRQLLGDFFTKSAKCNAVLRPKMHSRILEILTRLDEWLGASVVDRLGRLA